jgi:hypothetical protein
VWYLGEDTKQYEHGHVATTAGSWEAGVGGALAGVLIPRRPEVGQAYRQEYKRGEAEDNARVIGLDARATVPFGSFKHMLEPRSRPHSNRSSSTSTTRSGSDRCSRSPCAARAGARSS